MKEIYTEKYRQIGLKIAYYRKLRGLTQEELAEQVGADAGLYWAFGSAQHSKGAVTGCPV